MLRRIRAFARRVFDKTCARIYRKGVMRLRHRSLLAVLAALGVLLHAGTAAAQVFCAMTGTLTTACACDMGSDADMAIGPMDSDCCRDALAAPATDRVQQPNELPTPTEAAAWAQVVLPEPVPAAAPAELATAPPASSLRNLQTIVLIR